MGLIGRVAALAPLRAFPVIGWNGERAWRRLSAGHQVVASPSPHNSDLLVLSGEIPEEWTGTLRKLFETFALPRLALRLGPGGSAEMIAGEVAVDAGGPDWRAIRARLGDPGAPNNRPLLPDEPPAPWRGIGPHGQGGEGMMGGTPYGRPMAMTADDPDQLALGDLTTAVGPFFPGLPSGMELELQVQGDRVRAVNFARSGYPISVLAETPGLGKDADWGPAARIALGQDVRLAEVEGARIDAHLSFAADLLVLAGLFAPARRMSDAAGRSERDPAVLSRLWRSVERWGLRRRLRGLGVIAPGKADALGLVGPVARASGRDEDSRAAEPAYARAGFRQAGDGTGCIWARWQVRREECVEAARLIAEAGDAPVTAAEAPAGRIRDRGEGRLAGPSAANLAAVVECLGGMEWSEAVLFIASLGLDMREAAIR